MSETADDQRWLTVNGRRWRRTDPCLPDDVVKALTSHLGRGRSGVGAARRHENADAVAAARRRVGLAKHGLGERGPYWWNEPEAARVARARAALAQLDALDRPSPITHHNSKGNDMTSTTPDNASDPQGDAPDTEELEEPSTEKEPDEEPKGADTDAEPSHLAVGIGVSGTPPQAESESAPEPEATPEPGWEAAKAEADSDLPTDAVTDDVRQDSADVD